MKSWALKPWLLLLLATIATLGAAGSSLRASKPDVKKAVMGVIDGQLAAFRAGDVSKAYGFAAAPLRAQTSLRSFVAIVQTNYPELWANQRAEYGIVYDDGNRARVLVHVFSESGQATFDYVLLRERAGWRIGSVLRHDVRGEGNV
ncbi:MAG: DUF4864 domain-containing protein [Opitutaceae bacterium]|nr:DUF4864 domain-containing protein [Opitutaceae bacterium]